MGETRDSPWTPKEDNLFRKLAEANTDPEIVAAKLNQLVYAPRARAYDWTSAEMV
jgi:hypothetical protein